MRPRLMRPDAGRGHGDLVQAHHVVARLPRKFWAFWYLKFCWTAVAQPSKFPTTVARFEKSAAVGRALGEKWIVAVSAVCARGG